MNNYTPYENVYDRCAYKACQNGKNSNHHLFRFPTAKDPRREIWIENSGNDRLRSLTSLSLRRAGLCSIHFSANSFVIGNNRKLNSKAVPLPWTEGTSDTIDRNRMDLEKVSVMRRLEQVDSIASPPREEDRREVSATEQSEVAAQDAAISVKTYRPARLIFSDDEENEMQWMVEPEKTGNPEVTAEQIPTEELLAKALKKIDHLQMSQRSLKRQNNLLRRAIRRIRDKLKRAQRLPKLSTRKRQKKPTATDNFLDQQGCTKPAARTMIKLQLHQPRVAYSPEEKDLAKQLYYYSAAAYSRLRKAGCNFPGESSIRRWVAETDIRCGFSECIFEMLAENLARLAPDERVCALKWDEMSIKSYEEYSAMLDLIEGLADLGPLGRWNERASQLFVFCVDSINAKNPWRQPLSFFLPSTSVRAPELTELVKICLDKLRAAGADVRIVTCDQGPSNQTALTSPLYLNVSMTNQAFEHTGKSYYGSFDFPHLIKRLLYQMRTHGILYVDGQPIVAFSDFVETWKIDAGETSSNLLGHISEIHLFPKTFDSMNVKRAFQILSHTFASAIKLAGSDPNGLKSDTWQSSAAFAERMNGVIDAHNAYRLFFTNPMRRPLSPRNPAIEKTLLDFAEWASKWSTSPVKVQRAPCFNGLVITARAIVNTYRDLADEFPGFELAAGLCNQDSVEHLFSKLRQRGGHNANPTARMARLALRHVISTGHLYSSDKGNVQCPEAESLIQPSNEISRAFNNLEEPTVDEREPFEDSTEVTEREELDRDVAFLEENNGLADEAATETTVYTSNAVAFFAGYIAFRMMRKTHCGKCQSDMTKTPMDESSPEERYIEFKEYENLDQDAPAVTKLTRPTEIFTKIVEFQLSIFSKIWVRHWPSATLIGGLVRELTSATNLAFPEWFQSDGPCVDHRIAALHYLIRVKVYAMTRSNNQAARIFKATSIHGSKRPSKQDPKRQKLRKLQHD